MLTEKLDVQSERETELISEVKTATEKLEQLKNTKEGEIQKCIKEEKQNFKGQIDLLKKEK